MRAGGFGAPTGGGTRVPPCPHTRPPRGASRRRRRRHARRRHARGRETLHIGSRNCYDYFDTFINNNVVTPGAWVVQTLRVHINPNIRNRCDPNSWVIDGTYTTGSIWEGGTHKGNGGAWWMTKYNGGWHDVNIGYHAPSGIGGHEMRAYILSSISGYPTPSFYNGAARTWLEVVSAPTPPRNARAGSHGADRTLLQWDAPASDGGRGIAGYEIWRDGRVIRTVGAGDRSFVDGPFPPGECHSYYVKAWNAVGFSGGSNSTTGCVAPDVTAPSVKWSLERPADSNDWYNRPVRIDWTASDPYPSSGGPTQPPPVLADREGRDVRYESAPSCDGARNCTVGNAFVSLDTTPPVVTGTAMPAATGGWHTTDVTVDWACPDALSGDATCAEPVTLTEEGTHTATGTGTDVAGNTGTGTLGVNIDKTPPVTTHDAPEGWQPRDTTLRLVTTDNLSGVAATTWRLDGGEPQTGTEVSVSGDGVHTVEFWGTDVAGNAEPAQTVEVSIDTVAPTITAAAQPGANAAGWHDGDVTVTWDCQDERSGVASCADPVTLTEQGVHTVTGTVTDAAGNTASATYVVRIDSTGPSLVAAPDRAADGSNGWYRGPVTVSWTCDDALSGVTACPAATTLSSEGAALSVTGTARDAAGNETTATSAPYAIDLAAAAATVDPPRVSGVGLPVARAVTGTASDSMSGVARVEVQFTPSNGGAAQQPVVATCTGCGAGSRTVSWQVPAASLPRGSYVVRARAFDLAGHPAAWSAGVSMVIVG
jgi:hypothetical protein